MQAFLSLSFSPNLNLTRIGEMIRHLEGVIMISVNRKLVTPQYIPESDCMRRGRTYHERRESNKQLLTEYI